MSSLQGPILMPLNDDYNVVQQCRKWLYWQGYCHDDPEPNLEFYLQYFSPWLARLMVKHRYLRLALRLVRNIPTWFMIITLATQVFFLLPMGIYSYKTEALDVMTNSFGIVLVGIQLTAVLCAYLQQDTIRDMMEDVDTMLLPHHLDNNDQKIMFQYARWLCGNTMKLGLPLLVTVISLPLSWDYGFVFLPQRRFFLREWYPWNTVTSPNFEITLFVRWVESMLSVFASLTHIATIPIGMMLPISYFKILNNKFENIRPIAINRIKARKLKESVRSPEDTIVTIDIEHSRQVETPGRAIQGHQFRAGPDALNAGRVENLALLRYLYEVDCPLPGAVMDEMPLKEVIQGHQLRTGQSAHNESRGDNLSLLTPFYEVDNSVSATASNILHDERAICLSGITSEEVDNEMEIVLSENIILHVRLLRYMVTCASFLNVFLMAFLAVNTLLLGVTATMFLKRDDDNLKFTILTAVFTLMITSIYLVMNNAMQSLSDQHEAVCTSVYSCDWTGASPSFKKSMLVIMSRANAPLEMKPTGCDPLSRKNFAQVMNSAYKMFNTLNTFGK